MGEQKTERKSGWKRIRLKNITGYSGNIILSCLKNLNMHSDPMLQSYIDYSIEVMLGTLYYKNIAGISSMKGMTNVFNENAVVENISRYLDVDGKDFLPHG